MDKEKIEELKIQMHKRLNEAQEFIQQVPPIQLYAAIGVVLFTTFLFTISNSSNFRVFEFATNFMFDEFFFSVELLHFVLIGCIDAQIIEISLVLLAVNWLLY